MIRERRDLIFNGEYTEKYWEVVTVLRPEQGWAHTSIQKISCFSSFDEQPIKSVKKYDHGQYDLLVTEHETIVKRVKEKPEEVWENASTFDALRRAKKEGADRGSNKSSFRI